MPKFPSSPSSRGAAILEQNAKATVKWFDPVKGFGFATPEGGGADLFVHVSALSNVGLTTVPPGATITCDIGEGKRGPQIVAVSEVDESTATPEAPRGGPRGAPRSGGFGDRGGFGGGDRFGGGGGYGDRDRGGFGGGDRFGGGGGGFGDRRGPPRDLGPTSPPRDGVVKFFNVDRGFGFVQPSDGGADVFLHVSVLTRAGLQTPRENQPVSFTTRPGRKGEEVATIDFV
jgi:CspA family cold shock protein